MNTAFNSTSRESLSFRYTAIVNKVHIQKLNFNQASSVVNLTMIYSNSLLIK